MKTEQQINKALEEISNIKENEYTSMSYKDGLEEALLWVLEQIPDNEFSLTNRELIEIKRRIYEYC